MAPFNGPPARRIYPGCLAARAAAPGLGSPIAAPGHAVFRPLFLPALLCFSLTPWLVPPAARAGAMATVLALSMLFIWMAEQLYPINREWNARLSAPGGALRLLRDGIYLFGVTQLTAYLIAASEPWLRVGFAGPLVAWPASAPFVVRVLLAFLAIELFSYWVHRAAHRFALLWQFHSTHHFVTELNGLKSVRTHPVDNVVFYVARTVPLVIVGAGIDEVVAATYFGGVLGIFAHANVSVSARGLGLFFNFPQTHAAHHSSVLAESNTNFGCHTVLWDRVFGTWCAAPAAPVALGVAPVGRRTLWQELIWPFYRRV